jgi:putative ABC transport system permease protein
MLVQTYFQIALRNMVRNMRFTILHIMGLTIGLASVVLILWYVYDELSFDKLPGSNRVFRINTYWGDDPQKNIYATTPPPLAKTIESEIPEVENVARAFTWNHSTMRLPAEETASGNEVVFRETRIFIVDPVFLEVLEYPLVLGDRERAFERNEAIVLTRETAMRYFGKEAIENGSVIGKSILFGGDRTARTVTAVVDPPSNTHLHFDMLVNINFGYTELDTIKVWTWNVMHTYVKVREGVADDKAKVAELQAKLSGIATRVFRALSEPPPGESATADFRLQRLTDIHLHSQFLREHEANGNFKTVQILVTIALLILLLACANFINLFIVQSVRRAKEVGIRKTLGSAKLQLAVQFFVEAGLYTLSAGLLAMGLAELLRIPFNALSGKAIEFSWLSHPLIIVAAAVGFMVVVLLSGSYPSIYLSSFNPVRALKGNVFQQRRKNFFRNSLVIFQFSISIGLMICSVMILQQLMFMQNQAPGYHRENVIVVQNDREIQEQWKTFREELTTQTSIADVSFTTGLPGQQMNSMRDFRLVGEPVGTGINIFRVDENYTTALGIELAEGSGFSTSSTQNEGKILINEAAARLLGLSDPIGKVVIKNHGSDDEEKLEVIGVVRDFNVESFRNEVKPIVFFYYQPDFTMDYIAVRVQAGNLTEGLGKIEQAWRKFEPENPFIYSFLDKDFERQYLAEQRLSKLFGGFTFLALVIATIGLTGLASFMAEQRTKEIGIRKVLGATPAGIIILFSRDFTRLVLVAVVIAIPVSYYLMKQWLNDFAYRIDMHPAVFLICSFSTMVLMWVTVSLLSLRLAKIDPAKTLKME